MRQQYSLVQHPVPGHGSGDFAVAGADHPYRRAGDGRLAHRLGEAGQERRRVHGIILGTTDWIGRHIFQHRTVLRVRPQQLGGDRVGG